MARYDKTDPYGGTARAYLAVDWLLADINKVFGIGFDATGKLVKGAGASGLKGVIVLTTDHRVNEGQVDWMRFGCIVDFGPTAGVPGTDFGVAGKTYYAHPTTGVITEMTLAAAKAAGAYYVGHTQEKDRLEVAFNPIPLVAAA